MRISTFRALTTAIKRWKKENKRVAMWLGFMLGVVADILAGWCWSVLLVTWGASTALVVIGKEVDAIKDQYPLLPWFLVISGAVISVICEIVPASLAAISLIKDGGETGKNKALEWAAQEIEIASLGDEYGDCFARKSGSAARLADLIRSGKD